MNYSFIITIMKRYNFGRKFEKYLFEVGDSFKNY